MKNKFFLYSGLGLLCVAIAARWAGMSSALWIPAFVTAIVLKAIFLFNIIRSKNFKLTLWLTFIIAGVTMILVSLLFKYVFPVPLLRNILFYGAISLKTIGLILMLIGKTKLFKNGNKSA